MASSKSFGKEIMNELNPSRRKILRIMENNWDKWAKEFCDDRKEKNCSITEEKCRVIDCPKKDNFLDGGK